MSIQLNELDPSDTGSTTKRRPATLESFYRLSMGLDTATFRIGLERFFERFPTSLQVLRPASDVRTIWGDPSLVMTPAQRRAYSARSASWRCISCGKIHSFEESVAVLFASPCSCGNFEFESPVEAFIR